MALKRKGARPPDARMIAAKTVLHALLLVPLCVLIYRTSQDMVHGTALLGGDPVAEIEHFLGLWSLRILCLALAVTPLARLLRGSELLQFRRMVGLYAFAYATIHFLAYLVLDLGNYAGAILEDIAKRPFITVGFVAWLILLAMALTSTRAAMFKLGPLWKRLHRLVYLAAPLAALHFWWMVKSDIREPALYAAIIAGLLLIRIYWRLTAPKGISAARKRSTPSQSPR